MIYLLFFFQLFFRLLLQAFLLRMEEAEQATVQLTQRYTELQAECELSRAQLDIERSEARRKLLLLPCEPHATLKLTLWNSSSKSASCSQPSQSPYFFIFVWLSEGQAYQLLGHAQERPHWGHPSLFDNFISALYTLFNTHSLYHHTFTFCISTIIHENSLQHRSSSFDLSYLVNFLFFSFLTNINENSTFFEHHQLTHFLCIYFFQIELGQQIYFYWWFIEIFINLPFHLSFFLSCSTFYSSSSTSNKVVKCLTDLVALQYVYFNFN